MGSKDAYDRQEYFNAYASILSVTSYNKHVIVDFNSNIVRNISNAGP